VGKRYEFIDAEHDETMAAAGQPAGQGRADPRCGGHDLTAAAPGEKMVGDIT
jgi:hypothetical protein